MNYEYCNGMTHTVKQGETLYSLSRQYNVPLAIILRANPYIDVYNLQIGDTICIPVKNPGQQGGGSCMGCGGMVVMPGHGRDDDDDDDDRDDDDKDDRNDGDDDNDRNGGDNRGMGMRINMDIPGEGSPAQAAVNGMQDNAMNSMYPMGNMAGDDGTRQESMWIKYVAQAGDTLQDILDRSEGTLDMFWEKNQPDKMYMLPGVAYFILENSAD